MKLLWNVSKCHDFVLSIDFLVGHWLFVEHIYSNLKLNIFPANYYECVILSALSIQVVKDGEPKTKTVESDLWIHIWKS